MCEAFPEHADADSWSTCIRNHVRDYLAPMTARNAFGLRPLGLFWGDPGGSRSIGDNLYYRYFFYPTDGWWVGTSSNVLGSAAALALAATALDEPGFRDIAWRQLDWLLGVNIFDVSAMTGVGFNKMPDFIAGEFTPPTPPIDGAVFNGIGGFPDDMPDKKDRSWQTCEQWTPHIAYFQWAAAELLAANQDMPLIIESGEKFPAEGRKYAIRIIQSGNSIRIVLSPSDIFDKVSISDFKGKTVGTFPVGSSPLRLVKVELSGIYCITAEGPGKVVSKKILLMH
jgi:hypothetical protein